MNLNDTTRMIVREMLAGDREAAHEALRACGAFTAEEIEVALEVLDEGVRGGLEGDYPLFAAEEDGRVLGYVCVGRTPLTLNTWHVYWICVHPAAQGSGLGRALLARAEEFIRERGGERLALETSGRAGYERTLRFYLRAGYAEVGRIKDYYKPGDDCVFFCKPLV